MSASCKNGDVAAAPPTKLGRPSEFTISRRSEFASKPELTKQIGHPPGDWPVAAVKELVDNALDECERAGVAPVIDIAVDEGSIAVADNGSGIAPETVKRILDFNFKTSSNAVYQSPTRGQQGNAFQCLLAASLALSGRPGVPTSRRTCAPPAGTGRRA